MVFCGINSDWFLVVLDLQRTRQRHKGEHMIETILTIFAVGFLGVAVGVGAVCLMVWLALNED